MRSIQTAYKRIGERIRSSRTPKEAMLHRPASHPARPHPEKIAFVRHAVGSLGLPHCYPAWGTAEELSCHLPPDKRFDAVVARGVGSIAHLMRLARPLLRPYGNLLLRKPPPSPDHREVKPLLASPAWAGMWTSAARKRRHAVVSAGR